VKAWHGGVYLPPSDLQMTSNSGWNDHSHCSRAGAAGHQEGCFWLFLAVQCMAGTGPPVAMGGCKVTKSVPNNQNQCAKVGGGHGRLGLGACPTALQCGYFQLP
jgi:hypothetical protein